MHACVVVRVPCTLLAYVCVCVYVRVYEKERVNGRARTVKQNSVLFRFVYAEPTLAHSLSLKQTHVRL